jgi:hypothetical protein
VLIVGKKANVSNIKTLEQYLSAHCRNPRVTLKEAENFAQKGKQFLEAVMNGKESDYPSQSKSDNVAFLHWHLINESFRQNTPFSKGMFNLEGENDEATKRAYSYLKGEAKSDNSSLSTKFLKGVVGNRNANKDLAYSRPSTHYNDFLANEDERSFGIDKTTTPLAWKFTTHTFGLMKNPDNSLSVFFKPETQSMDVKKTKESLLHGSNLIKKAIKPEKLSGMASTFREDSIPKDIKIFVKSSLSKEELLTPAIKKKINRCSNIISLRKIIANEKSTLNLDEYLLQNYGTTNQIGSELRFKILDDGELQLIRRQSPIISQADFKIERIGSVDSDYGDDESGFDVADGYDEESLMHFQSKENSQDILTKYKNEIQVVRDEEQSKEVEDSEAFTKPIK